MIQRIQSIYLLLAAILMAVTAFSPILLDTESGLTLFSYGLKDANEIVKPTWGIVFMALLSSVLSLVAIFFYKNRKRQKYISLSSALVIILYFVTATVYLLSYLDGRISTNKFTIMYALALPGIALVLLLMASGAINKDEKLVKSVNRIR